MNWNFLTNRHQTFSRDIFLASVLILLVETDRGLEVVFEERAHHMKTQPGEISFPGGAIEPGETPAEAAIREACEELLLTEDQIELIGPLDYYVTPFDLVLSPWVARLTHGHLSRNPDEVARVFTVPLQDFIEHKPRIHYTKQHVTAEDDFPIQDYPFRTLTSQTLFYDLEGEVIWGMTAKVMANFVELIKAQAGQDS